MTTDSLDVMANYPPDTFDSQVCDPPYGVNILGNDWDRGIPPVEVWEECLRVLKPGGYLLAFGDRRTSHVLTTNVEAAGFEIKEQIMWIYYCGFPKLEPVGKMIDKSLGQIDPDYLHNIYSDGTSGLDVTFGPIVKKRGGSRCAKCGKSRAYKYKCQDSKCAQKYKAQTEMGKKYADFNTILKPAYEPILVARKPLSEDTIISNVLKHGTGALNIGACRVQLERPKFPSNIISEMPEHAPYFNCTKPTSSELNYGVKNTHPTPKPVELMRHLTRLVTPPGGWVLDPFMGSGTCGIACALEGFDYTGTELSPEYIEIAETKIKQIQADLSIN